ncbi:hypothetical protein Pint_05556 [Pistacia integerrima]|uniref:Uncharacterized protein n=1 Tax=Pistacia integerrima TaxID=434235 RepID=A0ACC0Z5A1_9ROSI|nr:hypothetical protein Pint_05556 [Pistacia integerrima]
MNNKMQFLIMGRHTRLKRGQFLVVEGKFGGQHPCGIGVPAVGMAFSCYVTQPQLGLGNSEMTWLLVLAGAAVALGATYCPPYIVVDGAYHLCSLGCLSLFCSWMALHSSKVVQTNKKIQFLIMGRHTRGHFLVVEGKFGAQHSCGIGVPAVGMVFPSFVTQPQLGLGNSEMTWLAVLEGAARALGATYYPPYIAVDGAYHLCSLGQTSLTGSSRLVVLYLPFL